MERCLYCYKELAEGEKDFHKACSKKMFGTSIVPELPYTRENLSELAKQVIRSQTTLTGVQAKLSLDIDKGEKEAISRFTIVGLWGRYILKPQADRFANLPEIEDLTMHLAELAKIKVVPHCLIRFADGELCYITRRIDRTPKGEKLPMEDMCQLTERLTEYKYKGSYEQIAKAIRKYSSVPKLDLVNYWEQVIEVMRASGLEEKVITNLFNKFLKVQDKWMEFIDISFLPDDMKDSYKNLIAKNLNLIR